MSSFNSNTSKQLTKEVFVRVFSYDRLLDGQLNNFKSTS